MDLDNGAQLMLAVLAFHETEQGTIAPLVGDEQPTYAVLTTLRLPERPLGRDPRGGARRPAPELQDDHRPRPDLLGRAHRASGASRGTTG